jgi:hypothetical protein
MFRPPLRRLAKGHRGRLWATFELPVHQEGHTNDFLTPHLDSLHPMKLRLLSLHLLALASLCARDFRPETHSENITLPDASIQECSVFTSIAGVGYTVESSTDLTQWTTQDTFYGTGGQHVVTLRQFKAPPPAPPGTPPVATGPQATNASLWLQRATGGGTLLSWPSLDQAGPMIYKISAEMAAGWNTATGYVEHYGNYEFYLSHPFFAAATPPAVNPSLGPLDSAMLAVFEANFAAMNAQVTASSAPQRNVPTAGSSVALPAKFFRIKVDPTLDTDSDGSPDWAEFQIAQNPNTPTGNGNASGNPFDPDSNHDGIPDGDQLDTDQDGTPDAKDSDPSDDTNFFPLGSIPRYAFFPVENATGGDTSSWEEVLQINDRGRVLYRNGTWSAGVWTPLNDPTGGSGGYPLRAVAYAINDNDVIIGKGCYQIGLYNMLYYWTSPQAIPLSVQKTPNRDEAYASDFVYPYLSAHDLTRKTFLSNDGIFTGITRQWVADTKGQFYEKFLQYSTWTLPTGTNNLSNETPNAGKMQFHRSPGLSWNHDLDSPTVGKVFTPAALPDLPFEPYQVYSTPNGFLALPYPHLTLTPKLYTHGVWKDAKLYQDAGDMSADGTAIKRSLDGLIASILHNGKWTEFKRTTPGLTGTWTTANVTLSNTTPNGWILAQRNRTDETPKGGTAVMLPLKVEGRYTDSHGDAQTTAVGVDDFSIGSDTPGSTVADRIWIMAPQGDFKKIIKVKAPLNTDTSLKMKADNVQFNNQTSVSMTSPLTAITLGASNAAASGQETLAELTLGPEGSAVTCLSKPIGLKIMKARTIELTIYKVTKIYGSGTEMPVDPDILPTSEQISNYLKDLYRPQINTVFKVNLVDAPLKVRWDLNTNWTFDYTGSEATGFEEQAIINAIPPDQVPYDIRIFLVANGLPLGTNFSFNGVTSISQATCWIHGSKRGSKKDTLYQLHAMAHEIGHVIIGAGHPDDGPGRNLGPAELPGTKHTLRLMCSGENLNNSSRLIVKGEWDKADAWLKSRKNGDN